MSRSIRDKHPDLFIPGNYVLSPVHGLPDRVPPEERYIVMTSDMRYALIIENDDDFREVIRELLQSGWPIKDLPKGGAWGDDKIPWKQSGG